MLFYCVVGCLWFKLLIQEHRVHVIHDYVSTMEFQTVLFPSSIPSSGPVLEVRQLLNEFISGNEKL